MDETVFSMRGVPDVSMFTAFTGKYKFGIASDDTSELWLSTDDDPQNLRKIACVGCIDQVCPYVVWHVLHAPCAG